MNKNKKRDELRILLAGVQDGTANFLDVFIKAVAWGVDAIELDDLSYSMTYIQRFFEDDQQAAIRGIHWLMDWVDHQSPFA